ncbi:MAG: MarR family transcriptional regulator, partial [Polyangiaceae bacterium]
RAIDIHSRYLASTFGLTGPQLVCLGALGRLGTTTPSELARHVALSQAPVTGIVDRLTRRQLVTRQRSMSDRRLVEVTITGAGRALLEQAPSALQETFANALAGLPTAEQENIRRTLNAIVTMMGVDGLDAAPILATDADAPSELGAPLSDEATSLVESEDDSEG